MAVAVVVMVVMMMMVGVLKHIQTWPVLCFHPSAGSADAHDQASQSLAGFSGESKARWKAWIRCPTSEAVDIHVLNDRVTDKTANICTHRRKHTCSHTLKIHGDLHTHTHTHTHTLICVILKTPDYQVDTHFRNQILPCVQCLLCLLQPHSLPLRNSLAKHSMHTESLFHNPHHWHLSELL